MAMPPPKRIEMGHCTGFLGRRNYPQSWGTRPRIGPYQILRWVGGRDEKHRGLCYDQPHVWRVTVVMTLPGVLRGEWDRWARTVPHPHSGVISSDIGHFDVFVAQ